MAWWNTQLTFQGDKLIAEGFAPLLLDHVEVVREEMPEDKGEPYTQVIVSGYALYGKLRGYYALGIAHWRLDQPAGRVFINETSQRNSAPVASLTPTQRATVREWLIRFSPEAWETSTFAFRRQLET
jgi:hypothetical protein